ncbi:MAG: diacylglycerol kinase family protein [Terrimicrobiaceae bacterium]|nr:diacylglycerol kinase family protein [Terrimicrobiaceae bacterium]
MPGLLIYNASAGVAEKFPPTQLLGRLPAGTQLYEFAEGDDAAQLARRAIEDGVEWIAVAGGDGTVEAVASALVDSPIPLGIIPCGTYNNFARGLNLPADPLEAAHVISGGVVRAIDAGVVNGRLFFECVGIGLDAALFPLGEEIKSGGFAKWIELSRRAIAYPRQTFDLKFDTPIRDALVRNGLDAARLDRRWRQSGATTVRLHALIITVSNGPFYGMNFAVAPDARPDSGVLTVTIFKRWSKLDLWWHYFSIRFGRRVYTPRLIVLTVQKLKIDGPSRLHAHADGIALKEWPLDFTIRAGALGVFS